MPAIKTLRLRVKDRHAGVLRRGAREVNTVWNACNAHQREVFRQEHRYLSGFGFRPFVSGASPEFGIIGSSTIDEVSAQYAAKRKAAATAERRRAKKECRKARPVSRLRWRKSYGQKRSLGWIPFKARATKWSNGAVRFAGRRFQVFDSYGDLDRHTFRAGCFAEDSRGRWYFCVQVQVETEAGLGTTPIGIDLGLKNIAATSDGERLEHGRWYRRAQEAVGRAQRARKRKRVAALCAKVRDQRKDAQHKWANAVVARASRIVIGDVSPSGVGKTKLAKSVYDAGWGCLKNLLQYKGEHAGIRVLTVPERNSTRTCSCCGAIPASSPKGRTGLRMREWICSECGARHDRDVNAARNILELGHQLLAEGIPVL